MATELDLIREHLSTIHIGRTQSRTTCPVCGPDRRKKNDKALSVKIDKDYAIYLCHHCGIAGSIPLDEEDAASPPEVTPQKVVSLSDPQIKWLSSRGISQETAASCGLTSAKVYVSSRGSEVDCVGFHYVNKDRSKAVKWRDGAKNFSQTGSARSLWRIEKWSSNDLIICEGEIDALSFEQVGIQSVSVPNGAPSTLSSGADNGSKYTYLWDAKEYIKSADRIVLATDDDEPGRILSEEIARRIGKARCWRVTYPDGCKDANDVLVKHGESALKEVLAGATPWPVSGLRDVSEYRSEVMSTHRKGLDNGIKLGVHEIDNILRVSPQTLTICTGIPGSGKSSFLLWLTMKLAVKHNWSTAILSAETPPRIFLLQMAALYHEKPYMGHDKMTDAELAKALDWLGSRYVILDDSETSISSVLERAQAAVLRMGVRVLVIDPFNFLTGSLSKAEEGSVASVNSLLISLKKLAVEHSIAIFLVAHPVKMHRERNGKVPIPGGYDVSGSSAHFNVCDLGISLSREGSESRLTVWKVRFPWIGKIGSTELAFDIRTGIFSSSLGTWGDLGDDKEWADI